MKLQSYEGLCAYLERKPGAKRHMPFGDDKLIYIVGKKWFVMMNWQDDPVLLWLKADPIDAMILRKTYPAVTPAWHMNKKHWINVLCDGSIPDTELAGILDQSYELVFEGLTRIEQALIQGR